jgi:hypothetical protein
MITSAFAGLIADARKLIDTVRSLPGEERWKPEHHERWNSLDRDLNQLAQAAGAASVRGHDPDGEGEAEFIKVLEERLEREEIDDEIGKGKQDARDKLEIDAQAQGIKKGLVVQKRDASVNASLNGLLGIGARAAKKAEEEPKQPETVDAPSAGPANDLKMPNTGGELPRQKISKAARADARIKEIVDAAPPEDLKELEPDGQGAGLADAVVGGVSVC